MKRKLFVAGLLLLIVAGMTFWSCQKEDLLKSEDIYLKSAHETCDQTASYDLKAGKTLVVGNLVVSNDDEYLTVTYVVDEPYQLGTVHLWAGTGAPPKNSQGIVVPGHFPYKDDGTNDYTFNIPLEDLFGDLDPCNQTVKIYAHAEIWWQEGEIIYDETAWAYEHVYDSKRWTYWADFTICCNPPTQNPDCKEETAWGGIEAGKGKAWWYYYDSSIGGEQPIYAGKELIPGAYVEVVNGLVNINLGEWELQDVSEAVKIKGYKDIPNTRPAAGLFTGEGTYKGTDLTGIDIGEYDFYAIHLDVMLCEE